MQHSPRNHAHPAVEGRRERNKRDKRNRIVGAARGLFQSQGYAATTTQQISKAAGIASGTLFLYARSKEDLLVLVFVDEMRELIEATFERVSESDPLVDQVITLFSGFVDYHGRDVDIARALIRELTFLSNADRIAEVNGIVNAIVAKLNAFVQRAAQCGEIQADVDARLLARCLFSLYYQQLQTWLSGYVSRTEFEAHLKVMVEFTLQPWR